MTEAPRVLTLVGSREQRRRKPDGDSGESGPAE